jgi:very-short-patch-repair endonuclease
VDWSNLKADYERLGSYSAVAAEYGVSKGYVAQQAKKQGINPKPEGRSLEIDWSELPSLYESGMTYDQLAARFGCSVHAIQNAMKRLGVTPRPTGLPEGYEWTEERRTAHRTAVDRPEWRAKNRANLLERLPTMRGPSANSPLEKLLQAALLKAGLSFSTQRVLLGRYCVDILIDRARVIIEADGALHNLRKEKDAKRDADLTEAGFQVFRFTGGRINRDAMGCVAEVVKAAGLTPDADPVADIRTGMMGPENPNWGGGPRIVICAQCGMETTRNAYRTAVKRTFCNQQCYGAWMSDHPEESNRRKDINWDGVAASYMNGTSPDEIMRQYGIGKTTLYRQLKRMDVELRRSPKSPQASKYSDEARASFRRGWEKRRQSGKAPTRGEDGRFVHTD